MKQVNEADSVRIVNMKQVDEADSVRIVNMKQVDEADSVRIVNMKQANKVKLWYCSLPGVKGYLSLHATLAWPKCYDQL